MEIALTAEQEAELSRLAASSGREADELIREAVSRYLDEEKAFQARIDEGLASLERGDYVTHEEMGERLRRIVGDF